MDERQPVRVSIFHQSYTLLASDPKAVQEVADTVDELMSAIASRSANADSLRVAVLACLHLADRLRSLESELSTLKRRVNEKSESIRALLDSAIEEQRG